MNSVIFLATTVISAFAFCFLPRWTAPVFFGAAFISASVLYISGLSDEALELAVLAFSFLIGALFATLKKQNDIYKLWK